MRWLKYDLHMHSNASHEKDNNVIKMEAKDFIIQLIDKEIDVFSVTDHNKFDSKFYKDLYKSIDEEHKDKIKLIPGVELDVLVKVDDKEDYLHILFYFYDNYANIEESINQLYSTGKPDIKAIIDKFNEEKYKFLIVPEGLGDRGISKYINKMSPDAARLFNIQGMYKMFGGFDKTVKDTFNVQLWAIEFYKKSSELKSIIERLGESEKDIENFLNDTLLKVKNGESITNQSEVEIIESIKTFSGFIARFKFSDWHNKETYNPHYYNHIFGDFSLPFESFELALIDPESRLIVNKIKKIEMNNTFLKMVKFELNSEKKELTFTEGLNVIIGARGSGKSLLHSIIKSLKSGVDEYKRYTKNFNIGNVRGILNNNQEITPIENYNSIEVIEQSKVEEYFEEQPELKEFLKDNFKDLEEVNLSNLYEILELLESIEYGIKIDDNIGPDISNIIETKGYIIKNDAKFKDYSALKKIANDTTFNFHLFIKTAMELGFQVEKLSDIKLSYDLEVKMILKNISLNEQFEEEIKYALNTYIRNSQKNLNRTQNAYQAIQNYLKRSNDYLESHFTNYKVLYLIDTFKLAIPKATYNYHELGYIFRSRSKIKESQDIKEDIKTEILATISRGNYDQFKSELKDVIKGNRTLNKNRDPKDSIKKYIEKIDKTTDLHIFKMNKYIQISGVVITDENIEEWIKSSTIQSVTDGSMGMKTVAYLDFAFGTSKSILLFDQPEDNIDNIYISSRLVDIIKRNKKEKQLIFVTHNPSIAVYADAFNYIHATQEEGNIKYEQFQITTREAKEKILATLDGGKFSFSNRNNKYGNVIGGLDYED